MPSQSPKDVIKEEILKAVCEEPGISSRQIHERLPRHLFKRTTPSIISKMAKTQNITAVNGAFYKFSNEIKKRHLCVHCRIHRFRWLHYNG